MLAMASSIPIFPGLGNQGVSLGKREEPGGPIWSEDRPQGERMRLAQYTMGRK